MKKIITGIFITTSLITSAFATDVNGTTKATATLTSTCSISGTDINLGEITPQGGEAVKWIPATTSGNISVLCTNKTTYSIAINLGANTSGGGRYLKGNTTGVKIYYAVCKTNFLTGTYASPVCGNSGGTGDWTSAKPLTGTGTGDNQVYPLYGFAATAYYTPDSYSDMLTATITY